MVAKIVSSFPLRIFLIKFFSLFDLRFKIPRSEFPSGTVPCNHRDWMNPQGNGFDSTTDFHPTICVGAMEEYVANGTLPYSGSTALAETKASYSNNGPGIDVWAPADETLAAGTNGASGYTDYQRRDNSLFL